MLLGRKTRRAFSGLHGGLGSQNWRQPIVDISERSGTAEVRDCHKALLCRGANRPKAYNALERKQTPLDLHRVRSVPNGGCGYRWCGDAPRFGGLVNPLIPATVRVGLSTLGRYARGGGSNTSHSILP